MVPRQNLKPELKEKMRLTKVKYNQSTLYKTVLSNLTWYGVTSCEGISCVTKFTMTNRAMIDNSTVGICPTNINARVLAFLVYACFVLWTFGAANTLWMASRR